MNNKTTLIVFIFLISVSLVFSQTLFFDFKNDIIRDLELLQPIYPRNEGSLNEIKTFDFIEKRLNDLKLTYRIHDFQRSKQSHSFSKFIEVSLNSEKKDTFILCIPINNDIDSPNEEDGSINIAFALAFLKYAKSFVFTLNIKVLFLGAEFGRTSFYPMGSRLFLDSFFPDYNVLFLYLNLKKIPSRIIIKCGAKGIVSPYWLINKCSESMEMTDVSFLIKGNQNQAFRTGLSTENTIIEPYLQAGYPALSIEGEYDKISEKDTSAWFLSFPLFIQKFIISLESGIPDKKEWDYHYIFFQFFNFYFILSEKNMLIIIIAIISIMILYCFFRIQKIKKYFIILKKNIWNLAIFIGLTFSILVISTLFLHLLLFIRSFPTLWTYLPHIFFILKIFFSIMLSFFIYLLLKKYKFPKNGSFYTMAALLSLIISIIVIAIINISFTYYFLWALLFVFLFSIARKRLLKLLFLIISPIWILNALVDFFTLPELNICKSIIFSIFLGNLLFTIIILPFVLLIIRIRFFFRYFKIKVRLSVYFIIAVNLIIISSLITTYILFYNPFTYTPQVIAIQRIIDLENNKNILNLSSEAPLGELDIKYKEENIQVNTFKREHQILLNDYPNLLTYSIESVGFLNRKNINIFLRNEGDPLKMNIRLVSDDDYVLYDANFPFSRERSGKEYIIYIGKNPPNPFKLELTLPKDKLFKVIINITYTKLPFQLLIKGNNIIVQTLLTLNKSIDIKT